ncbi:MBL fold metallo-hydrolase [Actinocatenispora comari]|uniref:Zn-dependent hydrolase n=1 Tax=Actinocatenispora comari TaxID=2807577 RepID=A0A8J4AJA1_9ACTN|nr:MBL fold metallo-hydrolase [Actinocatenispora comari]GIL31620.1 Zn-dependent hydrolase [Actinocatenispora comari]
MTTRIEQIVTDGVFELDGGRWDVQNNVWLVGDAQECLLIDAPHDPAAIAELVGGRDVVAIACTHAHSDHVDAALALSELVDAPVLLHPDDRVLWDLVHPDHAPHAELADGETLTVAGVDLRVLHTPGHSPGSCCFHAPALSAVFTGDTLFEGGPGATGRSYSDFDTIVASITDRLLTLPGSTTVHTGHGSRTTIAAEAANASQWRRPE